jgi:hypothetical protein
VSEASLINQLIILFQIEYLSLSIMKFRFCLVVFYFTAVLIFTVYLRSANNRIFNKLCTINTEQGRLEQQLRQKQLQLENLINPAAVSQRLNGSEWSLVNSE